MATKQTHLWLSHAPCFAVWFLAFHLYRAGTHIIPFVSPARLSLVRAMGAAGSDCGGGLRSHVYLFAHLLHLIDRAVGPGSFEGLGPLTLRYDEGWEKGMWERGVIMVHREVVGLALTVMGAMLMVLAVLTWSGPL